MGAGLSAYGGFEIRRRFTRKNGMAGGFSRSNFVLRIKVIIDHPDTSPCIMTSQIDVIKMKSQTGERWIFHKDRRDFL